MYLNCFLDPDDPQLGEFAARAGNYRTGVEIFEAEGNAALQNNLKKYQAKDHFFKVKTRFSWTLRSRSSILMSISPVPK